MRTIRSTLALLAALSAVACAPVAADAITTTRYVTATGDDTAACTQAAPCLTIKAALNAGPLTAGDVIDVGPGTFDLPQNDTTDISTDGLILRGNRTGVSGALRDPTADDETRLNAGDTSSLEVSGSNVVFDGLTVTGSGLSASGTNFNFENSLGYSVQSGTPLSNSGSDLSVRDSKFLDNEIGLYQAAPGLDVQGSLFSGNRYRGPFDPLAEPGRGILYANTGAAGTIAFNRFTGNDVAIESQGAALTAPSNFFGCNNGPGDADCDPVTNTDATGFLQLRLAAGPPSAEVSSQVQLDAGFVTEGTDMAPTGIEAFPPTDVGFSATPASASVTPATASTGSSGTAVSALTSSDPGTVTATATLDAATSNAIVEFTKAADPTEPTDPADPTDPSPPAQPTQPAPSPVFTPLPAARNPLQGTDGNDRIVGTPGNDVIDAGDGNDVIDGLGGNDIIIGGNGNDRIVGGAGRDRLVGGAGDDRMIGGDGDDRMSGGSGRDTMAGGTGDDELTGESGGDHVFGNDGNDRADGGSGEDRVQGDSGNDIVTGAGGDDHADGGSGRDRVVGQDGDDVLTGGSGNDRLLGGRGDDRLFGGSGRDVLSGGPGTDRSRQ